MKKLILSCLLGALLMMSNTAKAVTVTETITFDDFLQPNQIITPLAGSNYKGFNWGSDHFYAPSVTKLTSTFPIPSSYLNDAAMLGHGDTNLLLEDHVSRVDGSSFSFYGATFRQAFMNNIYMTINLTAYKNGDKIQEASLSNVIHHHQSNISLSWEDIDELTISAKLFNNTLLHSGYFMNDLRVSYEVPCQSPTPAPEPTSMLLGLLGVSGVIARKRKQA